jgi:adenylate cyclase
VGLVNVTTDAAGIPRHIPMIYRSGEGVIPSFALAAASAALNTEPVLGPDTLRLAGRITRTDLGYHLPIRYYGPRGSVPRFSAARALRGDVAPGDVFGQIVVVGATAVGVGDAFATPFDRVVPGVEIFATGISNLLAGDGLVRTVPVRALDAGAAVLLPFATVLLMAMRRSFAGLAIAGLMVVMWGALAVVAFREGYWLSMAVPVAALVPVAIPYGALRLGLDRYQAVRLATGQATLTRFQSPLLLAHILKNPTFLDKPVHQNVAAVFVDLSGFTGVAETLGPAWVRDLLAAFQSVVEHDVAAHDGFVVSFMGDGAMVIFGLPEASPDDAARALATVTSLHASIAAWLRDLPPVARDALSARIGAHFGPAVVSRLGPAHHQHITATGDTVNVTSRLLEVAKQQRCAVVVSEDLCAAAAAFAVPDGAAALEVAIRGRARPMRIRTWS